MPRIRAQVTLPWVSNIPEDVTVNVWHLNMTGVVDDGAVDAAFAEFYGGDTTGIADWLSPAISRVGNRATVKYYDLADPEPRQPTRIHEFTVGPPGSAGALPGELAVCVSMRAPTASGQPPARRRGRVYVGPLTTDALGDTTSLPRRPVDGSLCANLASGAFSMISQLATAGAEVCVYSRADDEFYGVEQVWVDNEFDIQRRRGGRATSRVILP